MKGTKFLLVVAAAVMLCGMLRECRDDAVREEESLQLVDTLVYVDTVRYYMPVAVDSVIVRYVTKNLPMAKDTFDKSMDILQSDSNALCDVKNTGDSVNVIIPITQKVYEDSTYRAYVSGYNPHLDSLFFLHKEEYVMIRSPTKSPRFCAGLQAGYGVTPKGFQPYIGVGIAVNLWSR